MAKLASVLIIDDNERCAEIMQIAFGERAEFEVACETRPMQAMNRILGDRPDLILLDVKMPDVDGFTLLTNLRSSGNRLPVLMCSGSALQSDIDRAYELGCNGYMVKPAGLEGYREMASAIVTYWTKGELPTRQ